MHKTLFAIVISVLFTVTASSQEDTPVPNRKNSISFGVGSGWLENTPALAFEGEYARMLGARVLTSVNFRMISAYSGFNNTAYSITPGSNFPGIDQQTRNISGVSVNLGYRLFPRKLSFIFTGGPGLYYFTSVENLSSGNSLEISHTAKVVTGFETSVAFTIDIANGLSSGIKLNGIFSGEADFIGAHVMLMKGF